MMARAEQLVGGRQSLSVPPGETAGAAYPRGLTDLFIGYAHYASQMAMADDLRTVAIRRRGISSRLSADDARRERRGALCAALFSARKGSSICRPRVLPANAE